MSATKKLVTIYVRKSRLKGDDEMEITRQIELLTDYADANNMEYIVFHEEGSSEDWEGRPELQKMLKELKSGIYDGVLVTEQDRISRDATDMGLFKRLCRKEELLFFTLNKTYNFMNDDDNFITGIQAEMDSHFMRIMKRKMLRGRIQAVESGVHFGIPPFGYDKSPTKPKILIKNPMESKAIEIIFDSYANKKLNQKEIADKINLLGYKTRENKIFTVRSISIILRNVVYIGTLLYELKNREPIVVEYAHEAIIPKKLFDETQVLRSERRVVPTSAKNGKYLLSQLIRCSECNTTLSFCMKYNKKQIKGSPNRAERELSVLNCYSSLGVTRKAEVTKRCSNSGIRAWRIEDEVLLNLEDYLTQLDDEIDFILQEGDSMFDEIRLQIKQMDTRLKQLDTQRTRVQEGYESGIYDAEEAKKKLTDIKEDKIKLELSKERIENMDSSSEIERKKQTKEKVLTLLSGDALETEEANKILRGIIDYVEYFKEKPDIGKLQPFKLNIVYK